MVKVKAVQDESSHWYVIPAEMSEEFNSLLEASLDETDMDAMYDAQDKFIEKFSGYMTGGDLNNVQLYAELK